jgi:prepilin-type N-terminal cleavage/methylation domain-containing protein
MGTKKYNLINQLNGFTLVEIALVLMIIGLVAGAMLGPLPCPAISAVNGNEAIRNSNGACPNNNGYLPWLVLGTPKADSWNRLFRYIVTANFANNNLYKPTLFSSGDISIHSSGSTSNQIALTIPIVLLSHGPNGNGAAFENGIVPPNKWGSNTDEQINATNTLHVISRPTTEKTTAPGGEFDDIVIWIPTSILFNRMVAAGQLP